MSIRCGGPDCATRNAGCWARVAGGQQIAIPSPARSSRRRIPWPLHLAAKCVLDRPDDGHISYTRGVGVQDRCAIHEPDRNVAAGGVAPQNVALAVTVDAAGPDNRRGGGDISYARRVGIQDGGAVHFPDCNIAAGVAPEDVPLAIAVEVAGADNRPSGGNSSDP